MCAICVTNATIEPEEPLLSGQAGSLQHGLSLFRIFGSVEMSRQHAAPKSTATSGTFVARCGSNVSADDDVSLALCGARHYPIQEPSRTINE